MNPSVCRPGQFREYIQNKGSFRLLNRYVYMLVEIVDKTNVQVSTYYFSILQAQAAGFFQYN